MEPNYTDIWNTLVSNTEEQSLPFVLVPIEVTTTSNNITPKQVLELIRDDLQNIHDDIENEDHIYDHADYDLISGNIREIHYLIFDKIKPILEKYIKEENG